MNLIGKENVENTEMELERHCSRLPGPRKRNSRDSSCTRTEPHAGPDSQETDGKEGDTEMNARLQ